MLTLDVQEHGDKVQAQENPGGMKIMADLGGEKSGLPFYAIVDAKGKKLADANAMPNHGNIGYPATADEIAVFEKLIKDTAPRMKAEQREKLIAHLRKVAPKQ